MKKIYIIFLIIISVIQIKFALTYYYKRWGTHHSNVFLDEYKSLFPAKYISNLGLPLNSYSKNRINPLSFFFYEEPTQEKCRFNILEYKIELKEDKPLDQILNENKKEIKVDDIKKYNQLTANFTFWHRITNLSNDIKQINFSVISTDSIFKCKNDTLAYYFLPYASISIGYNRDNYPDFFAQPWGKRKGKEHIGILLKKRMKSVYIIIAFERAEAYKLPYDFLPTITGNEKILQCNHSQNVVY